ncbi:DUF6769 family protein [uncultured Bacteroides sp.]|uniref:DUF6769 family protein n=1 Tax=uncultured Bacteroides sp. TaxID=162156 RepID=UPI002AAB968B|nr:DUF6769 family protein [uncultured Bacteroides sp.]
MRKKRFTGWLLLLVSMLVLIVPVLPHHHHFDNEICLQGDADSPTKPHQQADEDCDGYCITKLNFSVPHHDVNVQPHFWQVVTLFPASFIHSLLPPKLESFDRLSFYIESLHGAGISRTISLRAPPML